MTPSTVERSPLDFDETPEAMRDFVQTKERLDRLERAKAAHEDPTPGAMARRLDPLTVQTPALTLIDKELVLVRDALRVMFERRAVFSAEMASIAGRKLSDVSRETLEAKAARKAEREVKTHGNTRLLVSMPPQEGKTERIGRRGVVWLLRQFPGLKVGVVSYDGSNAERISYSARTDLETFDGTDGSIDLGLRLEKNQRAIGRWRLAPPHSGELVAVGIGGGLTGRPLDLLLIDDPVKDMQAADSLLRSSQAWEWWQTVARPRLAPWAPCIVVATRWHEMDLIGRAKDAEAKNKKLGLPHFERWRELNISAQAEPRKGQKDLLGRKPGEFMVSARGRSREQWEMVKAGVTIKRYWFALYQGTPTPDQGDVWLKPWWRRYESPLWIAQEDGTFKLPGGYEVSQSWDMAFKDKSSSDFVVGQVWAKKGAESFLIYQVWDRLDFVATLAAFKRVTRLFPQSRRKLVEDKANGTAVINSLKKQIAGIVPVEPEGGKLARAEATSTFIEAGNVHVPTPELAEMSPAIAFDVEALIAEATAFPNGANDDQVDSTSQYLADAYLGRGGPLTIGVPRQRLRTSGAGRGW